MDAQQMMVDTIANNIANANTNGFKKNQVNFQDLLYVKMQEAGREISAGVIAPSGMEVGSGVKTASTTKIFTPGEMQSTGNSLDMAIQGDGFFQVLLPNGEYRYTRDGSFQKDTNGLIVTSSGYQLSPGITVPSDATAVDISLDGTVSAELPSGSQVIGSIQLYRFPNNAGLTSEGGNLYRETGASGTAVSGNPGENGYGTILSQYLEKSNVEMVNELVNLITAQRAYEVNSRCIRVGDDMLQQLNQLVR
jgi:flagellar basal-body rod protein FlgG